MTTNQFSLTIQGQTLDNKASNEAKERGFFVEFSTTFHLPKRKLFHKPNGQPKVKFPDFSLTDR